MEMPLEVNQLKLTKVEDDATRRRRYKLLVRIGFPDKTVRRLASALGSSPAVAAEIDEALRDLENARHAAEQAIKRLARLAKTWAIWH